ncbi:MAG: imidazole glycerol phosphate synthase subunit HisH [Oscillospiraceae bacterium]|nr:imidazole glycerol phosphate synthase subunit HisH [Oscillospiraceae bacterium]
MIAIIDYGAGNIFSVKNALDYLGLQNQLMDDPALIEKADRIILPGVGAFPAAMKMLAQKNLIPVLKEQAQKKPLLGICLGMQMLLTKSYEFEECAGLDLIPGTVDKIPVQDRIIPHMGWNALEIQNSCKLLENLGNSLYVYFVHSYMATCENPEHLAACVDYGCQVPALITDHKFVFGAQFHPEKSGETGLQILRNFAEL